MKKIKFNSLIGRMGNKKTDIKYFKQYLPMENIDIIIEPFCGTSAVSKFVYGDEKYIKHLNDADNNIYNIMCNPLEFLEILRGVIERVNEHKNENKKIDKEMKESIQADTDKKYVAYIMQTFFIRGIMFKPTEFNVNSDEIDFYDKAIKTNVDYKIIMEKYKNNTKAFIFLDPPYLFSDNSGYIPQTIEQDMTHMIQYIHDYIKTCKCKVMLIINKLAILEWIFKEHIKGEYNRTYKISKKQNKHLIITNFDQ